jgi:hypothetical protein
MQRRGPSVPAKVESRCNRQHYPLAKLGRTESTEIVKKKAGSPHQLGFAQLPRPHHPRQVDHSRGLRSCLLVLNFHLFFLNGYIEGESINERFSHEGSTRI